MKTDKYKKIESNNANKKNSNFKSKINNETNPFPPDEVMDKILDEMLTKGCSVNEIFERFGLEGPEK